MSMAFEELEKHARTLSPEEKATLARILIEEHDTIEEPDDEVSNPLASLTIRAITRELVPGTQRARSNY